MSLLLSLFLVVSIQSGYSFAQTQSSAQSETRIEQKAKELGISVEELKARKKAEHKAKLEQKAQELGISVDELKAKIKTECRKNQKPE